MSDRVFIKGKYFLFIKSSYQNPVLVRFRPETEKFFAANLIIDNIVICNAVQDVQIENEYFRKICIPEPVQNIKIYGLKTQYNCNEKINFVIISEKEFELKIIVSDKNGYIRYNQNIKVTPGWKTLSFTIPCAGEYKIYFFSDNEFLFYRKMKITETKNNLIIRILKRLKDKIVFKIYRGNNNEVTESLRIKEISVLTHKIEYRTTVEKIPVKYSILYVPVKKIFPEINKIKLLSRIAIKDDFNPAGFLKVITALKEMTEIEEIKFIKNLFDSSPDIAYTLATEIFDFEILFSIPENELHEILNMIDDELLAYGIKGLSESNLGYIKKNVSEKRWQRIENVLRNLEITSNKEIISAYEKIAQYIRVYFQKKYGHKIDILEKIDKRLKIQTIGNILNYDTRIKAYTYYLSKDGFSKYWIVQFSTESNEDINLIFERDKSKSNLFYENIIYENEPFFDIIAVDDKNIYLNFYYNISKLQIVMLDENQRVVEIFNNSNILSDEIIKIKHHSLNRLRLLIGGISRENPNQIFETDIILSIYSENAKDFYIPEYSVPGMPLPLKDLSGRNRELFVFVNELKLPYCSLYRDYIELEKAQKSEIQLMQVSDFSNFIYVKQSEEIGVLETSNTNKITCISIFNKNYNFSHKIVYMFHPVIAEFYPVKSLNKGILLIHNPSETLCEYSMEIDTPVVFSRGRFKTNIFITDIKFYDYCKIKIKNIFGEYKYLIKPPLSEKKEFKIDIRDKESLHKSLSFIKANLYKEKNYTLHHLLLEAKIAIYEKDKNRLNSIIKSIEKQYFNGKLFRLTTDTEFNLTDTFESLNKLRVFLNSEIEPINSIIQKSLAFIKKRRLKNSRLWVYGRHYTDEYRRIIKHFRKQIKEQTKLTAEQRLYLYHNLHFTKIHRKAQKIEILPAILTPDFYLEIAHIILDLIIISRTMQ